MDTAALQVVDAFCSEFVAPRCALLPTLFYSLVNAVLDYDPVGWGVPYGSALITDTMEPLMNLSLQVLLVCLDYAPHRVITPEASASTYGLGGGDANADAKAIREERAAPALIPVPNLYRGLLAGLHSEADFRRFLAGIIRLLNHVHRADNTYLPYSMKQVRKCCCAVLCCASLLCLCVVFLCWLYPTFSPCLAVRS